MRRSIAERAAMSLVETSRMDAFLEWEQQQALRHEFVDGDVRAMAGAGRRHEAVALEIATHLAVHLRGTPCQVFKGDFAVRIDSAQSYYYPDIQVSCDARDVDERANRHPRLIIEVLSATTAEIDLGEKRRHYQTLAELQEYIVVDPKALTVRAWRRDPADASPGGDWSEADLAPSGTLVLASVGLVLDLAGLISRPDA